MVKIKAEICNIFHICDSKVDWTVSDCSIAVDSDCKEGKYSLKMISTGVQAYTLYTYSTPLNIERLTHLRFWIKGDDCTLSFIIYDSAMNQDYWFVDMPQASWILNSEVFATPDGSVGTVDYTDIKYIEFNVAETGKTIYFDFIRTSNDVDIASKIANCYIWSPMYKGVLGTPPVFRPLGWDPYVPYTDWDKRYQLCRIRIKPTDEAYFQMGDILMISDDNDVCCFYGRIVKKHDRMTSYIIDAWGWGDELMESIFKNAYSAKRTDEILIGQIDASSKSTQSSSIDQTTITMTYDVKIPTYAYIDLARYMERGVFWRVPGYDGKCYFDKDITDVNLLPDTGLTWTETTSGVRFIGKKSYNLGVTRAHVWGTVNSKEQVNKISSLTTEEQEKGSFPIFPYIDLSLTNYTEVNQLATALKNIFSTDTLFINIRVQGKGFLQWGKRVNFKWNIKSILPTADDYMIVEWIYDAKNDRYLRFIISNNTVFEREFVNIQKQLGRDIVANAQMIDSQQSESTADGTVIPGARHDRFVWNPEDAAAYHYSIATLTADGAWHDLDLSSHVPVGTTAVEILALFYDDAIGKYVQIRKNGQTNVVQRLFGATTVANEYGTPIQAFVGVDSDYKIEYNISTGMDACYIHVLGWKI